MTVINGGPLFDELASLRAQLARLASEDEATIRDLRTQLAEAQQRATRLLASTEEYSRQCLWFEDQMRQLRQERDEAQRALEATRLIAADWRRQSEGHESRADGLYRDLMGAMSEVARLREREARVLQDFRDAHALAEQAEAERDEARVRLLDGIPNAPDAVRWGRAALDGKSYHRQRANKLTADLARERAAREQVEGELAGLLEQIRRWPNRPAQCLDVTAAARLARGGR